MIANLPNQWRVVNLEDVADNLDSRRVPVNAKERAAREGDVPYYGATGQVGWIDDYLFDEELVLLGEDGAPFFDRAKQKAYVINGKSWVNNHAHVLRTRDGMPSAYLKHWLDIVDYHDYVTGTTRAKLNQAAMRKIPVPVAPTEQQRDIVAEIEKQFSRLDGAVANLKRYEAAVLKAAVEGKLTEEWRKAHPNVEPASKLLDRILAERRAKWEEAELAKMEAKGKAPKNDKWKAKYKKPVAPEATDLPKSPESWAWARLDSIAALKGGITVDSKRKDSTARNVSYLRVANVQRGFLDLNEVKTIKAPASAIEELRLHVGDILFNEGGDRDKLGRGWIWEGQLLECIHQNHVFRARLFSTDIQPKLVSWWGNSFGKDYFLREGKQTTNLASINLTKLGAFPVPLPPSAEQHRIVVEVDRHFSLIRETETQVDANLQRAERLRQSILSAAFTGRLRGRDAHGKPAPEQCFDMVAEPAVGYESAQ